MTQNNFVMIGALTIGLTLLLMSGGFPSALAQNETTDATQTTNSFTARGTINSLIFDTETTTASDNATNTNASATQSDFGTTTAQNDEPILPPVDDQPTSLLKGLEREQRGDVIAGDQPTQFEGQSLEPGPESGAPVAIYRNDTFNIPLPDVLLGDEPAPTQLPDEQGMSQIPPVTPDEIPGNDTQTAGEQPGNETRKLSLTQIARVLPEQIYIVAGNWSVQVTDGNVSDMSIDFVMVHPGGSEMHTHSFTNIASNRTVELKEGGNATVIATADIGVNESVQWTKVPFVLQIEKGQTVTIAIDVIATDNHFQGQQIYGIVQESPQSAS